MRGSVVKNTTCLEKMRSKMKLHVSAFICHRQVSTLIRKSLYKLREGVLMKRSLCIKPLFTMFLVQMIYVNNKKRQNTFLFFN